MKLNCGLVLILLVFLTNSCKKSETSGCFIPAGTIITETRELPSFNGIKMLDNVDVEFVSGDEIFVEVIAGENLIKGIDLQVENSQILIDSVPVSIRQLVIQNLNTCNWTRSFDIPFKVRICFPGLKNIEYRSIGDFVCSTPITSDTFSINIYEGSGTVNLDLQSKLTFLNFHYGTADLVVKGFSEINYIYQASYGPVLANELATNFTYLENRGSNNCYVKARVFLGATISSIGNVYYSGNPQGNSLIKNGSGNFFWVQ
jgi:hypothetical protein